MDYSSYYSARNILREIMEKDFVGPVEKDEVICDERPLEYYMLGKLYPQKVAGPDAFQAGEDFVQSRSEDEAELDIETQDNIALCNSQKPSSCGISICLNEGVTNFWVVINAGQYQLIEKEEASKLRNIDGSFLRSKDTFWKRIQVADDFRQKFSVADLSVGRACRIGVCKGLILFVLKHKLYDDGKISITVTLVNENRCSDDYADECSKAFFQPEILVTSDSVPAFGDVRRNIMLEKDPEVRELNMLYSKVGSFAAGHGCAADWETDSEGNAVVLKTTFMPWFEVRQMKPSSAFNGEVLSMKYLSEASSEEIISQLKELIALYADWIDGQATLAKKIAVEHREAAAVNIEKCMATKKRLAKAVSTLADEKVFRAFRLANRAMFLQRKKMLINTGKYENDDIIKWYPFQLAFFLQETLSFAQPDSDERKMVDLLWFPTGGGKTEAYLGIAAFTIFLRRLRYGATSGGVSVLMRYTMRLLSFQQFERAAALICACELIRKEEEISGGEIGIGLWAGTDLTPNYIKDATAIFEGRPPVHLKDSNPAQLKKCPWCGAEIPGNEPYYHCDASKQRMYVKCSDPACEFADGLPVYLIDEEIYRYTPTYVIATVDKFAQLALNEKTAVLFGSGRNVMPPDLIIQDELHLISGPLGTITGLYEAAINKLCEYNGRRSKIVASTATIRNASDQIRALYATTHTQFPPQGLDINDSFFAEISQATDKPARLYLGCMAVGTSSTTMFIRVMAALLFGTRYLCEHGYDEKVIDSFWTLTGYFNSLRELGGAIVRVLDDIQDRFSYLRAGKFAAPFPLSSAKKRYDNYKELTSREKGENIGDIIQHDLKIPYHADGSTTPYDFLLASNMISVGVDVGRLGTMVVVGQPKTTAEYIQATSRVGRETPGIVVTTYNQAKSRDRSHYEQFRQYHENFYKYVEATSVTPFSDRARDRALQALFVILCRYSVDNLRKNEDVVNFKRDLPGVKAVQQYILNYINTVDPAEADGAALELEEIADEWEQRIWRSNNLKYADYNRSADVLFDPDHMEESRFRILNTMRSVETMVKAIVKE